MTVAVLIPWLGVDPHRVRALGWVLAHYEQSFPSWDLRVCEAPAGPWCKAAAINPVLEQVEAEIVVVADADVWCDGLERAVYAVVCGESWAVPHLQVNRLTREGTEAVLGGADWQEQTFERVHQGVWGGGIVVGQRDALRDVPLDPRFAGWGQEDTSWALALDCLYGTGWRGDAPFVHLHHPPQARLDRQKGSRAGWELYLRYRRARQDPYEMRALIAEHAEEGAPWALAA